MSESTLPNPQTGSCQCGRRNGYAGPHASWYHHPDERPPIGHYPVLAVAR
jgi:hypothetical protein